MKDKIRGQRGSWFAKYNGEPFPVFWEHQYKYNDGDPYIKTDWIGRERDNTGHKREQVKSFCKQHLDTGQPTKAILAAPKESNPDGKSVPKKKGYIRAFDVLVETLEPEITLKIVG